MKRVFILFLFISQIIYSQKYFTRTGTTEFKASVDAFEPVEAINNSSSIVLRSDTGEFAVLLLVKAFKFKVALMQEHFNENYMDSDQYPRAYFKGKIDGFDLNSIDTKKKYKIKGILSVREIEKEVVTNATLHKVKDKIFINGNFTVSPADFNIKIPKIVRKKISNSVSITMNYELIRKK